MWLRKSNCSKAGSWFCRHQLRQTISWPQMGYFLLLWRSWLLIKRNWTKKSFSLFIWLNWPSRNIFQSFLDNMNYRVKIMVPKCVFVYMFVVLSEFSLLGDLYIWLYGWKAVFSGFIFSLAFYYQSNTLCTDFCFIT